ncbi:glycosyltransferase family 4 protein [Coraliomargarita parva]|uniref:glycosyltransferase family 4 protein n=1 Tax=Coraliomargarita parva TaxID=3014050 RepID=UPI0022B3F617|nr:glycosyltransferase family 4 protein [Coraliomargarita parva]
MNKGSRKVWVCHPTSNTFARALIEALERVDLLDRFYTCVGVGADSRNPLIRTLFRQRACPVPPARLHTRPLLEFLRLCSQSSGILPQLRAHETGPLCVDRIYHDMDRHVARELARASGIAAIYAYEDGALASFQAARARDILCLYDLPIGYWRTARRIQSEEAELQPEWAATMPALKDSDVKLHRKDEELQLADHIFVASRFTANSLKDAPFPLPEPVIVPYGCPPVRDASTLRESDPAKPLKVLFVGSLGQRKGVAYLLDAVERLGRSVELTLIGRPSAPCRPLEAALQRHKWIESLPHSGILEAMQTHDVLVFPSLFEGFGLVLTEALSQGLPVIATPHTAAPDLIHDGTEGYLVPIRDSEAIAAKLDRLAGDRDLLMSMRLAALERAQSVSWQAYQHGMATALSSTLSGAGH